MRTFEVTRFASLTERLGQGTAMTWPDLVAMLSAPLRASTKGSVPLWSPATFNGPRLASNVVEVGALVLDFDDTLTMAEAEHAAKELDAAWHTTWSHDPERPRFRFVVNTSRSLTPAEFARVWAWAFGKFSSGPRTPDCACKDASRIWLLPVAHEGSSFQFRVLPGRPLDVDAVLAAAPPAVECSLPTKLALPALQAGSPPAALSPRVQHLLRSTLEIRRLWEGQKARYDVSRSGCDFSFLLALLRHRVPVEDAVAALRQRPGVHSIREDYLLRTLRSALAHLGRRR